MSPGAADPVRIGVDPGGDWAGGSAARREGLAGEGGRPSGRRRAGGAGAELDGLAGRAVEQWPGRCAGRPFDRAGALEVYWEAY